MSEYITLIERRFEIIQVEGQVGSFRQNSNARHDDHSEFVLFELFLVDFQALLNSLWKREPDQS